MSRIILSTVPALLDIVLVIALLCPLFTEVRAGRWRVILLSLLLPLPLVITPPTRTFYFQIPDAVEYAGAALRLVFYGTYDIIVAGASYPPRYPPWFSMLVLAPVYRIFGPDPGLTIYPVTLFALLLSAAVAAAACRLSNAWGGLAAALVLIILPDFRHLSRSVMTDIPCAALWLSALLVYLRLTGMERERSRGYLLAGLLAAAATAFRVTSLSLFVPFVLLALSKRGGRLLRLTFLAAPGTALALATLTYNQRTFGTIVRSGYQYWTSVPYDYPALTFSPAYLLQNLKPLFEEAGFLPLGLIALAAYLLSRPLWPSDSEDTWRSFAWFSLWSAAPLILFYLFYFYPAGRFYLPAQALLAVLVGACAGNLARVFSALRFALGACAVVLVAAGLIRGPQPPDRVLAAARSIELHLPPQALVISGHNPVYLWLIAGHNSARVFLPVSRRVEYASKMITPHAPGSHAPPVSDAFMHRVPELIGRGSFEAVPLVAVEGIAMLREAVAAGRPVYLESSQLEEDELQTLRTNFRLEPVADGLFKLELMTG